MIKQIDRDLGHRIALVNWADGSEQWCYTNDLRRVLWMEVTS